MAKREQEQTSAGLAPAVGYHEGLAAGWNAGYARGGFRRRIGFIDTRLDALVASGTRWLDVGCGAGLITVRLAEHGAIALGIDGSPAMIRAAGQMAGPKAAHDVEFRVVPTVEKLDFPDASFDGLLCSSVLEYLDQPYVALGEMHRVLKPGGHLLISVANRFSLVRSVQSAVRAVARTVGKNTFPYLEVSRVTFSRKRIGQALRDRGFLVTAVEGFDPLVPPYLRGCIPASMLFVTAAKI
jgi:2-polyprenyl-6-hydroxyphenyl methylase/3-demethylubiquinone-9 3-methyltransferase